MSRQGKGRNDKTWQDKPSQDKIIPPALPPTTAAPVARPLHTLHFFYSNFPHITILMSLIDRLFHLCCLWSVCNAVPVHHTPQTKIKTVIRIAKREEKENKIRWSKNEGWKHISFKRRFWSCLSLSSALHPSHPTSTRLLTTATTTPGNTKEKFTV